MSMKDIQVTKNIFISKDQKDHCENRAKHSSVGLFPKNAKQAHSKNDVNHDWNPEKKATMVKMYLLRPVLASIELAKKASIARRQGLNPA
jgi:hypothetical protein